MKKYQIKVSGCDDTTYVEMELDEKEFKLIYKLAELSHKNSSYGCMPVIKIDGFEMERSGDDAE